MIYIISLYNTDALENALENDKKNKWAQVLPQFQADRITADDQIYVDASGMEPTEVKKAIKSVKNSGVFWGIIDPKGTVEDPALFFFDGANDYIGPVLVKKGLNKKRFVTALSAVGKTHTGILVNTKNGEGSAESAAKKNGSKLPSGKFEGWKSIRTGKTAHFFFLFVTITGKSSLRSLVGENGFNILKNRFRTVLQQYFANADALLWMETENNSLLLIPPRAANCKAAIEAALKMQANSQIIILEELFLSVPVEFTIALHYGDTIFQKPGKTGAVISESVNYIFHLGAKKAESGRLTISDDVPQEAIPKGLDDFFIDAGTFEGIPIRHSRRFVYKKR